jgi:uncharacterized Zn finger protein
VWVGVAGRRLTAECDCADAARESAALCVHAVALALEGIACGMPWAPAPPQDAEGVDPAAALAALDPAEKGRLLDALLEERPALLPDARRLAG